MRLILILIVIFAIFALIQTKRHNCEFGTDGWFDCVLSNTKKDFSASTGEPARLAAVVTTAQ